MMRAPATGDASTNRCSSVSAGGQLEHPSDVNSSTRTVGWSAARACRDAGAVDISRASAAQNPREARLHITGYLFYARLYARPDLRPMAARLIPAPASPDAGTTGMIYPTN